jgi:hypothetical protein
VYSKSPAPSFASRDSFLTAQSQLETDFDSPRPNPSLLPPSHSLRKSLSVDSFVSYNTQRRSHRTNTTSEAPQALFGISRRDVHSRDSSTSSGRHSDDLDSRSTSSLHRTNGQMSPGELLLPSRTPSLPFIASDGVPRIASASSLQSFAPKRASPTTRARSGSLGIYLPTQSQKPVSSQKLDAPFCSLIMLYLFRTNRLLPLPLLWWWD